MEVKEQPERNGFYWINLPNRFGWEIVYMEKKNDKWLCFFAGSISMAEWPEDYKGECYGPLVDPSNLLINPGENTK